MWENVKVGLLLLGLVIAFFLLAPRFPHVLGTLGSKPRVLVDYPTAVQGRITGSEVQRQHHFYYLDGKTDQYYDFNRFERPLTPAQQQLDEEAQHALGLGQQLKTGDVVTKEANSTLLTVQRGDSTSRWFCPVQPVAN